MPSQSVDKMRLAIIVSEFPKVTETFVLRDVVELLGRGHEVRIFHLKRFRRHEVVHAFAKPALECAFTHAYLCSPAVLGALGRALIRPRLLAGILAAICRAFRREPVMWLKSLVLLPKSLAAAEELRSWKADHVHAQFAGHPATSAWLISRFAALPYSVSCRGHDVFITQSLLAVKLEEAAFVRAVSHSIARFLREKVEGLRGRQIHVIHSSLDLRQFPPADPPSPTPFRILYVGSHHRRKGIEVLLQALGENGRALGEWQCRIAGTGPESRNLRRLSARLGLESRVEFLGGLAFEEVFEELRGCSVLVAPSTIDAQGSTEGIPNVVTEALACCRPVVATSVSGIPELIEHEQTGVLVAPGDAVALGEALMKVAGSPEWAYALAVRGRARVERDFDVVCNAGLLESLFFAHRAGMRVGPGR